MRYQSSFCGPLIGLFFFIASAWAQGSTHDCNFIGSSAVGLPKPDCFINENAEMGSIVPCSENVRVINPTKTFDVNPKVFDIEVDSDNKLQVLVSLNLSEVLRMDDTSYPHLRNLRVNCEKQDTPSIAFKVLITAENNHAPTFEKSNYVYEMSEFEKVDFLISKTAIIVEDRDYLDSTVSEVDVTIITVPGEEEGYFKVITTEEKILKPEPVRRYKVNLRLNRSRPPYKKGGYELTLQAKDKGTPSKSSTTQVIINVKDEDDEDPIFEHSVYTSSLYISEKENRKLWISDTTTSEGKEFNDKFRLELLPKKLFAFDQDIGINATILYELVKDNVPLSDYFRLGENDPVLELTKIDEKLLEEKSISLLVKAKQADDPKRHAFAMVNVQITTKPYEVEPIFTHEIELLRSQQEKVGFYNIQSSGKNPTFEITGPDSEKFELVGKEIQLKGKLTEKINKLEIQIHAKNNDSWITTNNTMKVVFNVVEVKTLQDPLFNRTIYRMDIWSDTAEQEVVFTVEALEDGVTFQLTGGDTDVFTIDRINGAIILEKKLVKDDYSLKVIGTLTGKVTKTDITEVRFNVVKKQLTLPSLFTRQIYKVDVFSDAEDKSTVFKIETTSLDVDVKIEKTEPLDGVFELNSTDIVLNGKFDPSIESYTIHVVGRINSRREETMIMVHVIPKTKPKESLFTREIYVIDVASDKMSNSKIFTPETTDPDVTISIEKTEPPDAINIFEINSNNRSINLNGKLDATVKTYTLHLLGKIDERDKNDSSKVYVHVIEMNRPTSSLFTKSQYMVNVPECQVLGAELFSIDTTKDNVTMEIIGGNRSLFEVTEFGKIRLLDKLKLKTEYDLEIRGTVSATNETDKTKVVLLVHECGQGKMYFEKCVYSDTIKEQTSNGHVLAKFIKENSNGIYTISSGNDEKVFDVEKDELILKKAAKDLKKESYNIIVSATAKGKQVSNVKEPDVTSEEAVVMVFFERSPQFLHPFPLVKVFTPSAPLSDYVFQINVKESSKQISFSLSGDPGNFVINSDSGMIYPKTDVTKIEGFTATLQVTAQYRPDLKSTLDIHIFRLKWSQTLMMTSSSSPEHTNVENITEKLSEVSQCRIIPLQYQALDQKQTTRLVKRSANTLFSQNTDSKLILVVAALQENKPLSLQEFEDLKFDRGKLTEEIGTYKIDQLPEPEEVIKEVSSKVSSNGGLVAGVAVLGTMVSLMVFAFVGVVVYKRYWPLLKKSKKESEANEEHVLKRWKPPTPPQRRTGKVNSETSVGVVNGGLTNDADHLYVDILPDAPMYMDILSPEIRDGDVPPAQEQQEPVETQNMEVAAITRQSDVGVESMPSSDDQVGPVTQEREARKSVVTFCEQADIIP